MALNLKDALETVTRAGFGSDPHTKSGSSERRMADSQRVFQQEPPADEAVFEQIDHHRNPQNMTFDQLLHVDDL